MPNSFAPLAGGPTLSIIETALIFVGLPALVIVVVAVALIAPNAVRSPRYRPGAAWSYPPVWFLPHPQLSQPVSSLQASGVADASHRLAVSAPDAEPASAVNDARAASGGASGEW